MQKNGIVVFFPIICYSLLCYRWTIKLNDKNNDLPTVLNGDFAVRYVK